MYQNNKIVGLDLSLTSPGMASLKGLRSGKLQLLDYQDVKTDSNESWYIRRERIKSTILAFVNKHNPDIIMIEGFAYGSRNGRELAGEVHGIVIYALIESGFPINKIYRNVAPNALKKFITGNGNASKPMMVEAINDLFHIELKKSQDDIADAIGLAFIGYCMCHYDKLEPYLNEKQKEVMEVILEKLEEENL